MSTRSMILITGKDEYHTQTYSLCIAMLPPTNKSSGEWARTTDPMINSHLLYQLSYTGIKN